VRPLASAPDETAELQFSRALISIEQQRATLCTLPFPVRSQPSRQRVPIKSIKFKRHGSIVKSEDAAKLELNDS
jgi:hypothetical protein